MLAALFAAVTAAAFVVLVALSDRPEKEAGLTFTPEEISVISSADSVMRVLTVNGCLSIPGHYGTVLRYPQIVVSYKDIDSMKEVTDTISGYTSVIFQHETDHLDGILYTDKVMKDSLFTVPVQH